MAVAVDERFPREPRRAVVDSLEVLAQHEGLIVEALCVLVVREERDQLVAEDRETARLDADDRDAGRDLGAQRAEDLAELARGEIEHAPVVERTPAAEGARRQRDRASRRLEHLDRRLPDLGVEVVRERVRPEEHPTPAVAARRAAREPARERLRRECRQTARGRDAADRLGRIRKDRRLRDEVREPRHPCGRPRPPVDQPHRVGRAWTQPAGIVMSEELRLVRRHVDVDGAVALASLAGEAEIERLVHGVAPPAVAERVPLHHLEEEARAAARRVLLLARHHEARAHRARVEPPAFADADAANRRVREAPAVVGEGEVRPR